jgi:hypothetical protein
VGRQFRLGQELYFVLWDEQSEEAGVARAEVVQYASDHSKVRVKVVDAPQRPVIGRTTWVLPDRLDDDARSARRNYQRRARQELREAEQAEREEGPAQAGGAERAPDQGEPKGADGVSDEVREAWGRVAAGWPDVELLVDTMDFEAGWPDHQARLAKFATVAVLRLRPALEALVGALPGDEAAEAVRTAMAGGVLASASAAAGGDPARLLDAWDQVPATDVAGAADQINGLRAALSELALRRELSPALGAE